MKNIRHVIDNKYFIREENNGLTIYGRKTNILKFYEGITWNDILSRNITTANDLESFLESVEDHVSANVDSKYPFHINWMIEDRCNLDCIYCFAHDKFNLKPNREDLFETAKSILRLNSLSVSLTGGEPTLNPHIEEIIKFFSGKIAITIDTNGTTNKIKEMIPLFKEANVLLRITVDTVNNDVLNTVRPPMKMPSGGYNQAQILKDNIKTLVDAGVQVMVHTVLTQYNINRADEIAEALIELGVNRWHMYGVNYSEKCKDFFDKIKVTKEEVTNLKKTLLAKYGDKINITFSIEEHFNANAIVLVNSNGEFFLDTITDGIKLVGKNPKKPTEDELFDALDYKRHIVSYLVYY